MVQLSRMSEVSRAAKTFTPKQGQYLVFIHAYTRLHRRPPAEADMQQYFRVSPAVGLPNGANACTRRLYCKTAGRSPQHRNAH